MILTAKTRSKTNILKLRMYDQPFVAKFKNIIFSFKDLYLYSTKYSFKFNSNQFSSAQIFIQVQLKPFSFNKKISIQLQLKLFLFSNKISIQLLYLKFPDIPPKYKPTQSLGMRQNGVGRMQAQEVRKCVRNEIRNGATTIRISKYCFPFVQETKSYFKCDQIGEQGSGWRACSTVKASFEAQAKVPTQHSSYIVRSSTKNQHIERFCGDVFFAGTHVFYYTFQSMEEAGILDRNNYLHLLVLHFIFLPRIYRGIDSFNTTAWNQHPIRTERNSRTLMHEDREQWDD